MNETESEFVVRIRYVGLHLLAILGVLAYGLVVVWTLFFIVVMGAVIIGSDGDSELTSSFEVILAVAGIWSVVLMYQGAKVAHNAIWTPLQEWWEQKRDHIRVGRW
jgi:hypothetical protein